MKAGFGIAGAILAFAVFLVLTGVDFAGAQDSGALAQKLPQPTRDADFVRPAAEKVKLGQLLFYDRLLSGSYRVSCATCHNHDRASSNGFALPGVELMSPDPLAVNGLPVYDPFKPSSRHAPALFNLGAHEFTRLFSDGRVEQLADGTLRTPAGADLPEGLDGALAAQALFPAVASDEMVGVVDSEIKQAAKQGHPAIWDALVLRLRDTPDYAPYFKAAFPSVKDLGDIGIVHAANAIAAFVGHEWRADKAPFDAYLRGDTSALTAGQKRGMMLFYGKAGCSACHSGIFQTDHEFHGSGLPVWRFDEPFDADKVFEPLKGREAVTGDRRQRYHLRTPSLRNVVATAPYGWAGSYRSLRQFLNAHISPEGEVVAFVAQGTGGFNPPRVFADIVEDVENARSISHVDLTEIEINSLILFLEALTDRESLKGRLGKPAEVPSALVID